MFCPYCGKQVDSDKKFCIYCGASLTPPTGQPGGVASNAPAPKRYYATKAAPILPGGVPAIIGIIVIILLIGFIGYSAMNGSWLFSPGTAAKPAPGTTLSPGGGSVARSYVVVDTETLTPVPTTLLPGYRNGAYDRNNHDTHGKETHDLFFRYVCLQQPVYEYPDRQQELRPVRGCMLTRYVLPERELPGQLHGQPGKLPGWVF